MAIKVYIQKRPSIVVQVGAKVINVIGGDVDSVNGQTGAVVLDASDVGAYPDTNPSNYVDAYGAAAAAPVQSVNGNTGAVVLTATDVGAPSGSGTSTGSNTGDQDLSGLQLKSIVVAGNITAVNDGNYTNVANAVYTDPSPVEGKGFRVMVRNGTATVGGTAYATAGTVILRIFHSGSWANYVYSSGSSDNDILPFETSPILITGTPGISRYLIQSIPIPTNITDCALRVTAFARKITQAGSADQLQFFLGTVATPNEAQILASTSLGSGVNNSLLNFGSGLQRTLPIRGGASGSITVLSTGNSQFDFIGNAVTCTVVSVDWTVQRYIYMVQILGNASNVMECYGRGIEKI